MDNPKSPIQIFNLCFWLGYTKGRDGLVQI